MFSKILIANRGEIACRIIKTAQKLGIQTVAVFSEIDAKAKHVALADEAFELGAPPPSQSYLNATKIIELALASGAEAIHPGYGFLAENAKFAEACNHAGIIFIGPSPEIIATMGNKDQAKSIVEAAGIPTTPGYHDAEQTLSAFAKAADTIGYPVLLKASAGGGGKGMRLVKTPNALKSAMESAKRESNASFGDDTLFLEKYILTARHVELQIFADTQGNKVHLFDRDCSIQRRHQKIIEEAPAPNLSTKTRKAMRSAALQILEAIHYLGAGTIEFLVDENEQFYFMEMNTRLQVEHPVTEMITGQDLVEWQIRVAAGEPLPLKQEDILLNGHAIEARICAEDPYENFTPSIGPLIYLDFPEKDAHIRVDTGVRQDDNISLYYDSMIAKVIAHADNRDDAMLQLKDALWETHIVGVSTNTTLLSQICQEQNFIQGELNTHFIEQHLDLLKAPSAIPSELLVLATLYQCRQLEIQGHQLSYSSDDPNSPWFTRDHWQVNQSSLKTFTFWKGSQAIPIHMRSNIVSVYSIDYDTDIIWEDDFQLSASINGNSINATIIPNGILLDIFHHGHHYQLSTQDPKIIALNPFESESHLSSPMPGNIIEITVKPNQSVKKGDKLITLEAMKMEHQILAPADGTVKALFCSPGDSVQEGVNLIEFEWQ